MNNNRIIILIVVAIVLKSLLCLYAATNVPDLKVRNDTHWYLDSGMSLVSKGTFGIMRDNGTFTYQYYRTPGYPLFLGIVHGLLKIPLNGVILLQIALTLFSAIFVYKTAVTINPNLKLIALLIILFDPAITLYSLMLLTESLYLLCISIFMYTVVIYLRDHTKKYLLFSALALVAATYVRPISIYLGGVLAIFILLWNMRRNIRENIVHMCLFVIIVYGLLVPWQWRNYNHFQEFRFSQVSTTMIGARGLYKSYERNTDPISQGLPPVLYYLNTGARSLTSLYTRPASFKYFKSEGIKKAGKVFSYLWIAFWLVGFLKGLSRIGQNCYFYFLVLVIVYFSVASVVGALWIADARFRIPMMPYIAIVSAYGWMELGKIFRRKTV